MITELENIKPMDIERRSFELITQELEQLHKTLVPGTEPIVKRCIHTSADFDYADTLCFSDGAVQKALDAKDRKKFLAVREEMRKWIRGIMYESPTPYALTPSGYYRNSHLASR